MFYSFIFIIFTSFQFQNPDVPPELIKSINNILEYYSKPNFQAGTIHPYRSQEKTEMKSKKLILDGKLRWELIYDDKGRLIFYASYGKRGFYYYLTYMYDRKDRLKKKYEMGDMVTYSYPNDSLSKAIIYKHEDEDNLHDKEIFIESDSIIKYEMHRVDDDTLKNLNYINEDGFLTKQVSFSNSDTSKFMKIEYDSLNRIIRKTKYHYNDPVMVEMRGLFCSYKNDYAYDNNGLLIQKIKVENCDFTFENWETTIYDYETQFTFEDGNWHCELKYFKNSELYLIDVYEFNKRFDMTKKVREDLEKDEIKVYEYEIEYLD